MIARRYHFVDVGSAAPALLRERQVHADADDLDVGEFACLFVEPSCLQITHGSVQRRDRGNNARLSGCARQSIVAQIGAFLNFEVRGRLSNFHFTSQQRYRTALKRNCRHEFSSTSRLLSRAKLKRAGSTSEASLRLNRLAPIRLRRMAYSACRQLYAIGQKPYAKSISRTFDECKQHLSTARNVCMRRRRRLMGRNLKSPVRESSRLDLVLPVDQNIV